MLSTFLPFYLLPPVTKFRGVFGGRKLFLPGHLGFIFDGRVETCFYCEVSYGPLVGCVIGGVTESHRRSVAITSGAERRGFVTNRGRDRSVATPTPERRYKQLSGDTRPRRRATRRVGVASKVYRSTDYSIVQNRCILKS
jgi:hypothetical protein